MREGVPARSCAPPTQGRILLLFYAPGFTSWQTTSSIESSEPVGTDSLKEPDRSVG